MGNINQVHFIEFMTHPKYARLDRAWVREVNGLTLYVRKPSNVPQMEMTWYVQIGNMQSDNPGSGALTQFLDEHEPNYKFWFENIYNNRLPAYLAKRGYIMIFAYGGLHARKKD